MHKFWEFQANFCENEIVSTESWKSSFSDWNAWKNSDEYFAHIVDVYRIQSQVYPQTIVLW